MKRTKDQMTINDLLKKTPNDDVIKTELSQVLDTFNEYDEQAQDRIVSMFVIGWKMGLVDLMGLDWKKLLREIRTDME